MSLTTSRTEGSAGTVPSSRISDAALTRLLQEDAPHGDLTTTSLPLQGRRATARFSARSVMVASGLEEAARLFELAGAVIEAAGSSGRQVAAGAVLLEVRGTAPQLLLAWKTAQTLVEAMSGIASATRAIIAALEAANCAVPVACTRKCFPGTRAFAARAVVDGGGIMHRLGLSETLLVFPEHMALLAPEERAAALAALRQRQPEKRVVVEVGDIGDALAAARRGADLLQLERFAPQRVLELKEALARENLAALLAAAGGITAANAVAYARAGASLLVTSAPYFAPPADVKVAIAPETT